MNSLSFILKKMLFTLFNLGWFRPRPEEIELEKLKEIANILADKYKGYSLIKKYEYLKNNKNLDVKTIKEYINEGNMRLKIHEHWDSFYEGFIESTHITPETESDLEDVFYDPKKRRIVFEIYKDKQKRGLIKEEDCLEEIISKKLRENKKLIDELSRCYRIYAGLEEMWKDFVDREADKLKKIEGEYKNNLEKYKEELINQKNRLNSLKYCADNYITDEVLNKLYENVIKFLPYSRENEVNKEDISDILKPFFEDMKVKIDKDIASLLNEKIMQIFCEQLNKDRLYNEF